MVPSPLDRFAPLPLPAAIAGELDTGNAVRASLSNAIRTAPATREEVAQQMSHLVYGDNGDSKITRPMLDSWTAQSRTAWRFPLEYLPAFARATGSMVPLQLIAERCGCRILVGEEALLAQMGVIETQRWLLQHDEKTIWQQLSRDLAARILMDADPNK